MDGGARSPGIRFAPTGMRLAVFETAPRGGLLHYATQLADGLASAGHDVDLVVAAHNELAGREGPARRRAVLTPPVRAGAAPRHGSAALRRAGVAVRLTRAWARIVWEGRRRGYDAVIVTGDVGLPVSAGGAIVLAGLPGGPPVGLVCHNVRTYNRWAGEHLFEGSRLQLALERWMYRLLDVVFVHGEASREEFERTWPVTRLEVIPHGDERLFGEPPPPAAEPRLLFFGEWRKVKGLPLLMDAWDLLAARDEEVRLTVAGAPDPGDVDAEAVRRWAAGHDGRVELIEGYVPVEDVAAIFARARVVVAPYAVAYQSGVVHLAQTLGRAVVATDVGDLGDVVRDGRTGRLVPPGDPAALAAALGELAHDTEAAARLGAEGRARVRAESSWELVGERVAAALAPLAGHGG